MAYVKVNKGLEKKTTSLSKFLRILRIENDELLAHMAEKLGIMPSYLSSIEANRRDLSKLGSGELEQIRRLLKSFSMEGKKNEKRVLSESKNNAAKGV
ncbi:MAG: hypothetical protein K5873_08550 [Treponema sp.]|nr:hypothetical protein [Treponema sp.]